MEHREEIARREVFWVGRAGVCGVRYVRSCPEGQPGDALATLKAWFATQLKDAGEYREHVTIEPLDRGWSVDIRVDATDLEAEQFAAIECRRDEYDWLVAWRGGISFQALCGAASLTQALQTFLTWAYAASAPAMAPWQESAARGVEVAARLPRATVRSASRLSRSSHEGLTALIRCLPIMSACPIARLFAGLGSASAVGPLHIGKPRARISRRPLHAEASFPGSYQPLRSRRRSPS